MVLVRFEPLNPLTPDPGFGNLFCVFWQAIGEFQFLVSVIPASYWGNSSVQGRFCRQAIGDIPFRRSCCFDKLLGNSYPRSGCWGIPLWKVLKVSVYLFFESLQHSGSCHAWAPEGIASLTLVCRLFLAGSTRVAVILNPPAGPLRRFDFDGLVTLRCCKWQE